MRRFLFLISLFFTINVFAQTTASLDTTYGFKQFKFQQKPNQIADLKKAKNSLYQKDGVREYKYTGNDISELNTVKLADIILSFYHNKLFAIRVNYATASKEQILEDFNKIQYGLSMKFGTGWSTLDNGGVKEMTGRTWKSEKVILENAMNSGGWGYINILERKVYREMMNGE